MAVNLNDNLSRQNIYRAQVRVQTQVHWGSHFTVKVLYRGPHNSVQGPHAARGLQFFLYIHNYCKPNEQAGHLTTTAGRLLATYVWGKIYWESLLYLLTYSLRVMLLRLYFKNKTSFHLILTLFCLQFESSIIFIIFLKSLILLDFFLILNLIGTHTKLQD